MYLPTDAKSRGWTTFPVPSAKAVVTMAMMLALLMLVVVPALPQAYAEGGKGYIPGGSYTVPTQYESDDHIDWGPSLVIWGCIIVFAFGLTMLILSRLMAWIRKWG